MLMGGLRNTRASVTTAACSMPGLQPGDLHRMQKVAPPVPTAPRPLWVVVLSAGLIIGIAMGIRQVMGLYMPPMTKELGIGREPFSTALAIANLVWASVPCLPA